ncbi:glycine/betaine ABC transporter substrate-binding protein [Marichromatium purpuratum 984]|uniref:Glycine/betaine ABC transporter substrate-binding protein n=1 Tax=Marichromatium purpuratum 984 TaxID=765910 RepID=W0E818_MARPU|nr:glycine betaine ABC transporter substrate-binding protein [Marichromatium purpuratum]AHF05181.1 glycine/betaine ABC transporter substrate-binding protein [Marichromatium purpuratum 984]
MIKTLNRKIVGAALAALLSTPALGADKGEIELAYGEWATEIASVNVVRVVLEDLGYEVKTSSVSVAAMWQALAAGDVDAMVAAWLPTTHQHYLDQVADEVVDLGPNLEGTRIGLVVPSYVEIDSIAELNAAAARFDGEIIGIDPSAGLMKKTELAMEAYGIDQLDLVESTGAIMTAVLGDAIEDGDWVVVTGWTPHWKFARYDLKYLEDPENVFGGAERIHTFTRQGLAEEMPEAVAVLDNFHWTPEQMAELMVMNQQDKRSDPYDNARRWVEAHPEVVEAWLP